MAGRSHRSEVAMDAAIVSPYLPEGFSASENAVRHAGVQDRNAEPAQQDQSSLILQGGDVHRDVFKIRARVEAPRRSATFSASESSPLLAGPRSTAREQQEPGGFRRQFVERQVLNRSVTLQHVPVASSFIAFLDLYGSFAGENLADTDSDASIYDDDAVVTQDQDDGSEDADTPDDSRRPLLQRRQSSKRAKSAGTAGSVKTFFTLLKAFVGTGIMFLPKAFRNGGLLFSSMVLVSVASLTTVCFRLLLKCRDSHGGGGYGEIGEAILGKRFRSLVLSSIALSQLGFVCTGIIFTAENLFNFLDVVSGDRRLPLGSSTLISLQLIALVPLALIRNISKLGPVALLADLFILFGLLYIWSYDIGTLADRGVAPELRLFNPAAYTLTIGSAIFTFEGIGLILPIQSSMRNPQHFSRLLYTVMVIITVIFTSVGVLCYATFGEDTDIQVLSNFPRSSKLVQAVQFVYSLAVLAGNPVQLFPATRIIETSLFGEKATGKKSSAIKWKKNALRTGLTVLCVVVALLGASDLDRFVALIGSFACVPLVYIYPPLLHLRGNAVTSLEKAGDVAIIVVGFVAMGYTTAVTLSQWLGSA